MVDMIRGVWEMQSLKQCVVFQAPSGVQNDEDMEFLSSWQKEINVLREVNDLIL